MTHIGTFGYVYEFYPITKEFILVKKTGAQLTLDSNTKKVIIKPDAFRSAQLIKVTCMSNSTVVSPSVGTPAPMPVETVAGAGATMTVPNIVLDGKSMSKLERRFQEVQGFVTMTTRRIHGSTGASDLKQPHSCILMNPEKATVIVQSFIIMCNGKVGGRKKVEMFVLLCAHTRAFVYMCVKGTQGQNWITFGSTLPAVL